MSEQMNAAPVNRLNHQLITLLRHALRDAEAGRFVAGGVLLVPDKSGFLALCASNGYYAEVIAAAEVAISDTIQALRAHQTQLRSGQVLRAENMPRAQ